MQNDTDRDYNGAWEDEVAGDGSDQEFAEGERVIVDKESLTEQYGTVSFFFGDGYCEIYTDDGDRLPVHIFRLTKA